MLFRSKGRFQGVAEDHWVTLDLGPAPAEGGEEWLVGQGWIYPTDSSINRALGQGSRVRPRGLSLEIKTGAGWKTARDGLGFPAGKNKTVLIPLNGLDWGKAAPGQPRLVRLKTNLEIYWDRFALAKDRDPAGMRLREMPADTARLAYRGFSAVSPRAGGTPEIPRYGAPVGAEKRWRDLRGFHTRFGDVEELVARVDDRYVIMNAGDEMGFRFRALEPPGPGFVRDFFLEGDGWEKDGDFNTGFARTVLPLPSHARPAYTDPEVPLTRDPVFQANAGDWLKYHTRYVDGWGLAGALAPAPGRAR